MKSLLKNENGHSLKSSHEITMEMTWPISLTKISHYSDNSVRKMMNC